MKGAVAEMNSPSNTDTLSVTVVPKPLSVRSGPGFFSLSSTTVIELDRDVEAVRWLGGYLTDCLSGETNERIQVRDLSKAPQKNVITLQLVSSSDSLGVEGYELSVKADSIQLRASKPQGLFYGIQTLRQLTESDGKNEVKIPCVKILDRPRFRWRGVMLDCARHFMTKDYIKRTIDRIAFHKLNVLHLHLTDDQGWRIEIKKYSKLMETGAWRGENQDRYGGYYTQDDLKEIVVYAKERFVEIVPEFDMPGHASAAIASYPELSCHGKTIPVETGWGIFDEVFCPGKENTFAFLEGVLVEIMDIFPSPYIHIGGDEAPRKNWEACAHCQKRIEDEKLENEHELQSYLIQRVARFLSKRGRILTGWDEILQGGGLPQGTVVQSWQGMEGAVSAAKKGMDVISSPLQFVYYDYPQTEKQVASKPDWMRLTTLETVYTFDPVPDGLTPQEAKHVLGGECTVWTEHAPQPEVDRQLFPRTCAFAETVWTPEALRDWDDFSQRLEPLLKRLERMDVDYYRE